jgi:5-methylcytosine-specific restriction endonuclease McrA
MGIWVHTAMKVTRKQKEAARNAVWERCGGKCEECGRDVIYDPGHWASMHTAHIRGGIHRSKWDLSNLLGLCMQCHLVDMHNPKSVPRKQAAND